jgi:hypothetical protein
MGFEEHQKFVFEGNDGGANLCQFVTVIIIVSPSSLVLLLTKGNNAWYDDDEDERNLPIYPGLRGSGGGGGSERRASDITITYSKSFNL